MKKAKKPAPPGYRWVFVPRFKHHLTGKMVEASDHGLEAFCFLVRA